MAYYSDTCAIHNCYVCKTLPLIFIKNFILCTTCSTCPYCAEPVTSRLDYANGLLHNAPISVIKKLDRVQRSSARVVCRLHKYQWISMTEVLHDLHWLPVASRIKYKLLIVTFKALRTGTPGYLSDLLVKQKITKRTRSQSIDAPDRLIVPLYSGERSAGTSYSVAAPKLWNSLPASIRSSRSLDTFKKHLKTHYFKEHFYGI